MICDRVAIVVDGKIRSQGALDDLLDDPVERVEVVFNGLSEEGALKMSALAVTTRSVAGRHTFTVATAQDVDAFVRAGQDAGGRIVSVSPVRQSLEALFVAEATREASQ
jgi:ABC-type multidrug transport system ATPase subunit